MALIEIDALPFLKMGGSFHGKLFLSLPDGNISHIWVWVKIRYPKIMDG